VSRDMCCVADLGAASCIVAETVVGSFSQYSSASIACFDTSDEQLRLLEKRTIDFVVDQQQWLQGYLV